MKFITPIPNKRCKSAKENTSNVLVVIPNYKERNYLKKDIENSEIEAAKKETQFIPKKQTIPPTIKHTPKKKKRKRIRINYNEHPSFSQRRIPVENIHVSQTTLDNEDGYIKVKFR
jgi:hypothetical protein